jgi:hypothetical protein
MNYEDLDKEESLSQERINNMSDSEIKLAHILCPLEESEF